MLTPSLARTPLVDRGSITPQWLKFFEWLVRSSQRRSEGPIADIPTHLKLADKGYLYEATDYAHVFEWTGSAWRYAPGDRASGEVAWFTADPGTGWAKCDGAAVSRSLSDATTAAFTTPNLIGRYMKGAAAYTGALQAAVAPGLTGETADEAAHTHSIDHDHPVTQTSTPSGTAAYNLAAGATVVPLATHFHDVDLPALAATSGAGAPHRHAKGSLSVDATAEPAHIGLIPYFRL